MSMDDVESDSAQIEDGESLFLLYQFGPMQIKFA